MMESFGLYEDLSLFSGDLLVGINPLADELPTLEQDVFTQDSSMFSVQSDPLTDELIKPTHSENVVADDWMEKKNELLNLFASSNVQISIQSSSPEIVEASLPPMVEISSHPPVADSVSYTELAPVDQGDLKTPEELLQSVSEYLTSDLDISTCSENASAPFGDISMDTFSTADGLASMLSDEDLKSLSNPILSPVSPQDIESILSAGPSSPCSTASINDSVVPQMKPEGYILSIEEPQGSPSPSISAGSSQSAEEESLGPMRPVRASRAKKYSPYVSFDEDFEELKKPSQIQRSHNVPDRKERKKQQNKDAALRYRMKKKNEQNSIFEECDELEKKNEDLKDKVDSMTREIQYLKDLLLEVYKAKGIQPKGLLVKNRK